MKKTLAIVFLILTFFIIYFLQSNFFIWFNIAGIMPNIYVILVLFIGLFVKRKAGLICGLGFGLYLDIVLGKTVGISALVLNIVNRYTANSYNAVVPRTIKHTINLLSLEKFLLKISPSIPITPSTSADIEILAFLKILLVELVFNELITIIIYPIIKKAGYYLENLFDDKFILTRYF